MGCRLVVVWLLSLVLSGLVPGTGKAQSRTFRLSAPEALVSSGFLKHLLPRFSLKTQIRIELVDEGSPAEAALSVDGGGRPVFEGPNDVWLLDVREPANAQLTRFTDWLASDVGQKTIESFKPDGKPLFKAALGQQEVVEAVALPGDVVEGEKLSVLHCGRCHMVNEATRMSTIGSSPSFAVMRSFNDWQARFEAFFVLKPHPAFTKIDGVTPPFDISRPSPIAPVEMTLEDLEAILAFVSQIPPADLGAPIQYQ